MRQIANKLIVMAFVTLATLAGQFAMADDDGYSVTARSLSYEDVSAAAKDVRAHEPDGHGTIYLPEGDADWGKRRLLLHGGISVIGKGIDKTTIRWDHGSALIAYNDYEEKDRTTWDYSPMRISGISFQASETSRGLTFNIRGVQDFRIDHIKIETRKPSAYMLTIRASTFDQPVPRGVLDHCTFIAHERGNYVLNTGPVLWDNDNRIENLGTKQAVFMEDCHFENAYHAAASFNGGHYVVRHCTFNNASGSVIDAHGPVFQHFSKWESLFKLTPEDEWKPLLDGVNTDIGLSIDHVAARLRSAFKALGGVTLGPRTTISTNPKKDKVSSWDVVDFSDGKAYRISSDPFGKVTVNQVHGGRCLEVYNNTFTADSAMGAVFRPRSGGGVIFNNTIKGFRYDMILVMETASHKFAGGVYPGLDQIHDLWIWNNTQTGAKFPFGTKQNFGGRDGKNMIKEDRDFFLRAPSKKKDGFEYTPYTYPHPLTLVTNSSR